MLLVADRSLESPLPNAAPVLGERWQPRQAWAVDPLEADQPGDDMVVTTKRRILRLAVAASDVGARFAREGRNDDAAAWMLAERRLFDGQAPIEACQDIQGFRRSIVLHGLGLGVDADPEEIDWLLLDDDADGPAAIDGDDGSQGAPGRVSPDPRLLTCWVDVTDGDGRLFAFCALVTQRPADLVERVYRRFGRKAAEEADYRVGFDRTSALSVAMISEAMTDTLGLVAADPRSPLASGLDIVVEQRFEA